MRISDDTLKQQQNLKVRAEKERTEKYIESLITEDEGTPAHSEFRRCMQLTNMQPHIKAFWILFSWTIH